MTIVSTTASPPVHSTSPPSDPRALFAFNTLVLLQALDVVRAHRRVGGPDYANPIGAHLRHVIEHYEALIFPADAGIVDYDSRPRDLQLQQSGDVADGRLHALLDWLAQAPASALDTPLRLRALGGLDGDVAFAVDTTFARELAFVAGHAIHHYALLRRHCEQYGIAVPHDFGKAPSTVAHERASIALRAPALEQESR